MRIWAGDQVEPDPGSAPYRTEWGSRPSFEGGHLEARTPWEQGVQVDGGDDLTLSL